MLVAARKPTNGHAAGVGTGVGFATPAPAAGLQVGLGNGVPGATRPGKACCSQLSKPLPAVYDTPCARLTTSPLPSRMAAWCLDGDNVVCRSAFCPGR